MEYNLLKKLINFGLYQNVESFYTELTPDGLSIDYNQDETEDMLLPISAFEKFISEIISLNNGNQLKTGEEISFSLITPFGQKIINLTVLAGDNKKYSIEIKTPDYKKYRLNQLGFQHDILQKLNKHLQKSKSGLIVISGDNYNDRNKIIESIVKIVNSDDVTVLNLNNQTDFDSTLSISNNKNFLYNLSKDELISLIRKQQIDIVINNLNNSKITSSLIELANDKRLIILSIEANSSQEAWHKLTEIYPNKKNLSENINFIIGEKFFPRLCPYCLKKHSLNNNELNNLKKLAFIYNKTDMEEKAKTSPGCNRCNHTGKGGEIGTFEVLSFKNKHLNTPSLIDDAWYKYEMGLINADDLLKFV
ncbi:hypothetical protein EOL94_02340 [bacterium]|nr:hypothetical protein [bacterium]